MVELVREDPPHVGIGRGSWVERLLPLMDHPGEWFRIATSDQKKGGESTSYALRSGRLRIPPGRWEFTSAWVAEAAESRAYARYLGDPSDPVEAQIDPRTQQALVPETPHRLADDPAVAAPDEPVVPVADPVSDPPLAVAEVVTVAEVPVDGGNPPVFSFGADHKPVAVQQ